MSNAAGRHGTSDVVVRAARPDELRVLATVHRNAWLDAYGEVYPAWFLEERPFAFFHGAWEAFLDDDRRPVLVAEVAGDVTGLVRYGRPSIAGGGQDSTLGEVFTLYVAADRRGHGIGATLLTHAETELVRVGHRHAQLSMVAGSAGAQRFYERAGWQVSGRFFPDFGGFSPELLRLTKKLTADGAQRS